jgi:hypothetical protein
MSAIYLGLADVRNLLLALGKPRTQEVAPRAALELIASALGVSYKFLTTYSDLVPPLDHQGLPLYKQRLLTLAHLISTHDTSAMKNTQRLDMLASVFDRRADAMMHQLKSNPATVGKNPSLDEAQLGLPAKKLEELSFKHCAEWKASIERLNGLYIVVGNQWATRSLFDPSISHLVSESKMGVAAFSFADFDMFGAMRDSPEFKLRMDEIVQQAIRHSQALCFYGAGDVWDMDAAIAYSKKIPTFVTAYPHALEGVLALADMKHDDACLDVSVLSVETSSGELGFTDKLRSSFKMVRI